MSKPRIYLTRMTVEDHFDDFWEIWKDERALGWSTHAPKVIREDAVALMTKLLPAEQGGEEGGIDKFAVMLREEGGEGSEGGKAAETNSNSKPKMIGFIGTNRPSPQGLEFGYCINYDYWGKGYATEAARMFLDTYWGLEERKSISGLVAKVDPGNIPSERIVKRLGGRKGELLKEVYKRNVNVEKSDLVCWYFDRPGSEDGK
ncbi:hypothetical protein ACMFMG_007138 [Clarireedia jacksonii]